MIKELQKPLKEVHILPMRDWNNSRHVNSLYLGISFIMFSSFGNKRILFLLPCLNGARGIVLNYYVYIVYLKDIQDGLCSWMLLSFVLRV